MQHGISDTEYRKNLLKRIGVLLDIAKRANESDDLRKLETEIDWITRHIAKLQANLQNKVFKI